MQYRVRCSTLKSQLQDHIYFVHHYFNHVCFLTHAAGIFDTRMPAEED